MKSGLLSNIARSVSIPVIDCINGRTRETRTGGGLLAIRRDYPDANGRDPRAIEFTALAKVYTEDIGALDAPEFIAAGSSASCDIVVHSIHTRHIRRESTLHPGE